MTVRLREVKQTIASLYCTLDCLKTQSCVHPRLLTVGALTVYDFIECDVTGRGQHAGLELLALTRDR